VLQFPLEKGWNLHDTSGNFPVLFRTPYKLDIGIAWLPASNRAAAYEKAKKFPDFKGLINSNASDSWGARYGTAEATAKARLEFSPNDPRITQKSAGIKGRYESFTEGWNPLATPNIVQEELSEWGWDTHVCGNKITRGAVVTYRVRSDTLPPNGATRMATASALTGFIIIRNQELDTTQSQFRFTADPLPLPSQLQQLPTDIADRVNSIIQEKLKDTHDLVQSVQSKVDSLATAADAHRTENKLIVDEANKISTTSRLSEPSTLKILTPLSKPVTPSTTKSSFARSKLRRSVTT
jgi:hypothetical protein